MSDRTVLPSLDDPVAKGATELLGGGPGRRARLGEARFWTPLRWVLLLTLVVSALGFLQKSPCRVHDWTEDYQYTRVCYTDVYALYGAERLDDRTPYLEHPVEYPVVIGAVMGLVAPVSDAVAGLAPPSRQDRAELYRFYDLTWVVLTGFALVVAVTTARLAGRRTWDAAMFALAPSLLLHGTTNWDLVAVAFAGLGLLAWARRMPVVAGVMLGLGAATKLYPVLFLVPLLALCWRTGTLRAGLQAALATLLTAAALVLPVYLVSPSFAEVDGQQVEVAGSPASRFGAEGWAALAPHTTPPPGSEVTATGVNSVYRFVDLNRSRPADWDSLAYAASQLRAELGPGPPAAVLDWVLEDPPDGDPAHLNLLTALGTIGVCVAVVALAVRAPRRPRLPQLLTLVVIGFLLVNKVYSPQYVLWLVPLVALARPRWRLFLLWQVTEVLVLLARFYYFVGLTPGPGGSAEGVGVGWFVPAVLLRDLLLVVVAAAVVREVLRPEHDVVRTPPGDPHPVDDPAGGIFDGAPDRAPQVAVAA